ncbi:AAA family ATPase [Kribbella sp. CA-293567]|uniref:AAA family ATPase n=1 Tax=Kribbella sp. CA-293567 TaxID=3002436 RepID=UPI0022DE023F|nr:AAA family ATPase [Kribbella sp. CA-293567]WBQ02356.1 AAA family ATPase [Kribbella sp. CA-293567]
MRVLDVLGADRPWQVPDEWLVGVRDRLRAWGEDPKALRPGVFPDFVEETPAAVWFAHQVAPLLAGWIPVLHGDYADLSPALTRDFHRPTARFGGDGHRVQVAATDWPLLVVSGARSFDTAGRLQALQLSRDVASLFVDAPPLAARAKALLAGYNRVLADREATRMHVEADYDTIVQFWRTTVLSEAERAVLPELAGPAAALRYSLDTLRDAHGKLSAVVADNPALDFSQLLARLIRAAGLSGQPPAVGQILGVAGWDVEHALADLRRGFDPQVWSSSNVAWLERAIEQDQELLARSWAAAATRVTVHLSGVLESGPWPDPEVPDLGAIFRLLDRSQEAVTDEAADAEAIVLTPPTGPLTHTWGSNAAPPPPVAEVEAAAPTAAVPAPLEVTTVSPPPAATEADDFVAPEPMAGDDALAELEALIGLESIKEAVRKMVAEIQTNQRRKEFGLPIQERARHMVFVGKPGTAKTTIARLLAKVYKQLGVLETGHVVEVDRSDLVGSGVGTTAPMTAAKFREALGGVLFVDEAYTLVPDSNPGDYGLEAVATLLKMMEDHRDECVVIVAGYHREMQRFLDSNPGLASRFPKLLSFSEYSTDQLIAIFALQARQKGMIHNDEVLAAVRRNIPAAPRGHNFGNGRFIRNLLEEAISNQATRLSRRDPATLTERDLREILPEDVKSAGSMRAEDYLLQKPGT